MRATKEQNLKTSHGITLIALVITIIVMLILVAVTITMAVNGGLFGKAADAGRQTNEAVKAEQELGSGKVKIKDGTTIYEYDNINAYFTNTPSKVYQYGGDEVEKPDEDEIIPTCSACGGDFGRYEYYCSACELYLDSSESLVSKYWTDDCFYVRVPYDEGYLGCFILCPICDGEETTRLIYTHNGGDYFEDVCDPLESGDLCFGCGTAYPGIGQDQH